MQSRRGLWGLIVVAGVLALAACTGAPQDEESDDAGPFAVGPFWVHITAELGESQADLERANQERREAAIATCMTEVGFEYFPDSQAEVVDAAPSLEQWEEDLRAWGWGYFTRINDSTPTDLPEKSEQEKYYESLSPGAQAEYEAAFIGERDPTTGEPVPGQEGCIHLAFFTEDPDAPDTQFADLLEEFRGAWEVAEQDQELIATRERYRTCMTQAGFPGIRLDAAELLEERMLEEFPDMSFAHNDPRLPELAEWETRLANTHLDCADETGVFEATTKANAKVEREIMERRAEEVEAYVAALREQAAG